MINGVSGTEITGLTIPALIDQCQSYLIENKKSVLQLEILIILYI